MFWGLKRKWMLQFSSHDTCPLLSAVLGEGSRRLTWIRARYISQSVSVGEEVQLLLECLRSSEAACKTAAEWEVQTAFPCARRHWRQNPAEAGGMCGFCKARVFGSAGVLAARWEGLACSPERGSPTGPQRDWRKEQDTSRQDLVDGWGRESNSTKGGCGNRDHNIVRVETVCSWVLNWF